MSEDAMFAPPPPRTRLNIAVLLGILAAFFTHMSVVLDPEPRDAALILRGTHAVLTGQDPYVVVRGLA